MVFYRKYRPQKLSELDSESVRNTLTSIVQSGKIPHAFLFVGPKGLGKTSAARILAKIVNCEKRNQESGIRNQGRERKKKEEKDHNSSFFAKRASAGANIIPNSSVEPCNRCSQCLSITNGTNLDVLEIDAASNRGIDEIRQLREGIKLAPFSGQKKVYIIDEVHMLTQEAFNALLKTLEEPPAHAMFIMATTEPHKLPETIVSRCFQIPFQKATNDEILVMLKRIVKVEKINITDEALLIIAKSSDGSFRDGAKLLEELVFHYGKKQITEKAAEEILKTSSMKSQAMRLISFLSEKNTREALAFVDHEVTTGLNIRKFMDSLIEELHTALLKKAGVGTLSAQDQEISLTIDELKDLVTIFSQKAMDMKYAVVPQLPLELGIIEWGIEGGKWEVGQEVRNEERGEKNNAIKDLLQDLIQKVKPHNHSIAGVLRGCKIKSYDGKRLIIEAGFPFHKERLDEDKTRQLLERVSESIVGNKVSVSVMLKEKPA